MAMSINKMTTVIVVLVVAVTGVAAVVAMTQSNDNSNGESIDLVVGTTTTIKGTNVKSVNVHYWLQNLMYLPLINWNYGVAHPCLAESWTAGPNFEYYDVVLRDDVRWSDGENFTADDVVISVKNKMASSLSGYSNVEKIDDYRVKITMGLVDVKDPSKGIAGNANWPAENTNLQIFPEHIFRKATLGSFGAYDEKDYWVATGPMILDDVNLDAGIVKFRANKSYYAGEPSVSTLTIRTYSNVESMMLALLKGEVDTFYNYVEMGMDTNYLTKVLNKGYSIKAVESAGLGPSLWFNQDTAIGADINVRQAVRYAMNYEEIISYLAKGVGEVPNTGVWTPRGAFYKETDAMEYNPEKARSTLDNAGWTLKEGEKYRTNSAGDVLEIDLLVRQTEVACVKATTFISEYLEDIGIKTSIKVCDTASFMDLVKKDTYEITVYVWTSGAMDSRYGFLTAPLYASQMMGQNIGEYPEVVKLVKELRETNINDRKEIAFKIQDYWSENAPIVPLYWYSYLVPYNSEYTGLCSHSTYGILCVDTMMNLKKT